MRCRLCLRRLPGCLFRGLVIVPHKGAHQALSRCPDCSRGRLIGPAVEPAEITAAQIDEVEETARQWERMTTDLGGEG